jgi:TrmH family RNA methyltransferase
MAGVPPSSELDRLCVVLVATRNPLNIGAAARAMSNFGVRCLRVVNPYETSFREARSAVGAAPLLKNATQFQSVADAIADCSLVVGTTAAHNRELQQPLKLLPEAAPLIRNHLKSGRVALLFGSEKRGLANSDLSYCHWLLRIPTREEHGSMNLGQSVAVCLYALASSPSAAKRTTKQLSKREQRAGSATAGELDRVTQLLVETLRASGYLGDRPVAAKEEKVRRMVRRLDLSAADAEILVGMLRQIAWKLNDTD